VADAATRAEASSAPGGNTAADRLALVPGKEGGKGAGVQGGSGKGDAALRQDLLRSQEQLTSLQQQGADLKSRLKDLQDINDKNTRLLALKDNEIAELQQKLADARKKAGLPAAASTAGQAARATAAATPATPASTTPTTAAKPAHAGSVNVAAGAANLPAAHSVAIPAVSKPVARPASKPAKPAARKPTPVTAEQPWFMQPWVWAAAGGAILLLILIALLGRRRKPAAGPRPASAAPSLADRFGALPDAPAGSADPDQDELLDQLAEHPDDIGLHLELVSLYYSRRDVEHFEAAAEAMHAHIVDPQQDEWQDVLAMGEDLVPGHPLFAETGHGAPDAFASHDEADRHDEDALHPFDLDSYADHAEETEAPAEPASSRPKVSEYHFDFNLTPPPLPQATAPGVVEAHADEPEDDRTVMRDIEPAAPEASPSSWNFEEPVNDTTAALAGSQEPSQFSDDPIDTKLDLARAYMDMGDADGARAMLEEVMNEGSQMQQDAAQRLLDSLA